MTDILFSGKYSPLYIAVREGNIDEAMRLISLGADVNASEENRETPLLIAAKSGNKAMVKLLIAKGADVNKIRGGYVRENGGWESALYYAALFGHLEVVELLIDCGASLRDETFNVPLNAAARKGHLAICELLIAKGADVNARDGNYYYTDGYDEIRAKEGEGVMALHSAVERGHLEVVKLLISKGADINARRMGGETPLHLSTMGKRDLVQLLVANGADVNARDNYGNTPLLSHGYRFKELAELFIAKGADANAMNMNGVSVLYAAVREGCKDVVELLIANGTDINFRTPDGNTPLHGTAGSRDKDIAELLIAGGADVNAKALDGRTPLHVAAMSGANNIAELLIVKGADINARTKSEETPLHFASLGKQEIVESYRRYSQTKENELEKIERLEKIEEVAKLLISKGADANVMRNAWDQDGETLLHKAARNRHVELVVQLLEQGPDVDARSQDGKTPLHEAAESGYTEVVELLLLKKADANVRANNGDTPLHKAALNGHRDVAELLIEHGADVNSLDGISESPLHKAAWSGHKDVAELLIAKNAEINIMGRNSGTPLHKAIFYDRREVVELLIVKNADIHITDNFGYSAIKFAEDYHKDLVNLFPQHTAALFSKPEFTISLPSVINKIASAENIQEILPDISKDICTLLNADRVTIYVVGTDKESLRSIVKSGLNDFKELKLPIAENCIAGFSALHRKLLNIKDVYDEQELASFSPALRLLKAVDKRTGYHSKQMLVAPILEQENGELFGVIQVINNKSGVPFPVLAEEGVLELTQTLAIALRWAQSLLPKSKYSYLVEEELMSRSEFELAGRAAQRKGIDIEDLLLDEFLLSPASIGNALSSFYGVPYEPINADRIRPTEQLKNLKRDYVESSHWIPIEDTQEGLVILTTDPERIRTSGVVKNILCRDRLIYKVCSQREFKATVDLFFGPQWEMSELTSTLFDDGGDEPSISEEDVNKMINLLIEDAYKMGASDIHIEPGEGKVKTVIRLRINGSMINHLEVPWTCRDALVNRVKFMCDLDTAEKRKPQVGRIKFEKFGSLDLELRVSIVPVHGGVEHVTLRILALGLAHGEPIPLDSLGFSARNLPLLKRTISLPYGLFIVCGPTGSGRTTTLHSVLNCINTLDIKIWTAEDPVEINQKGLNQVQINEAAGLDFATAMQTILSSDPDVIMVSEPRDSDMLSKIIDASLLGHMVFTTLHANNAPEAIFRLQNFNTDNFNFTDAFLGVLAQRLARRLCGDCKKPHVATTEELKTLLTEYSSELLNTESWKKDPNASFKALLTEWVKQFGDEKGNITLYEKVGCEKCSGVGYRGRVGLHELLIGTEALKNGLLKKACSAELTEIALEDGMRTMRQDGIEKVLLGLTDMQIVRDVCDK